MNSPTQYIGKILISIFGLCALEMIELFANSGDPDQLPHSAASDLVLHCLPFTLLGVSSLQQDKSCII